MTARTPLGRLVFFLDYDDGGGGRRFANSPGLLPMLGHLRRVGADVTFVSSEEALFGTIEAGCDWVGISSMERMLPQSVAIARRVRETQPGLVLLLGGSSIDRVACQLAADVVDVVVLGESELILPAVLAALAGADTLVRAVDDRTRPTVAGPAHPGGALSPDQVDRLLAAGFVRRGPDGPVTVPATGIFVRDPAHGVVWQRPKPESAPVLVATARRGDRAARGALQDTAPLDHELDGLFDVPWDEFATQGWTVFELYAQRGCRWGRCEFCSVADRNVRALSPRKVAETIRAAVDRGISTISFADDLFVQHAAWNDELLRLLADPPIAELELRAQTMANKTVWPHLEAMAGVGFKELAFGLETFVPRRAELWRKSLRGHSYVTQGKETILRTAAAGILPVIYLIVVDPTSTLPEVAGELADCVEFLRLVYRQTGIVPRLSSSMSLLPVADVPVTERYEYSVRRVPTRHGEIVLPDEFRLPPPLARLVTEVDAATADLPYRRDNLDAFDAYFASLAAGAAADGPAVAGEVDLHVARGRAALSSLRAELEVLAEHLAQQLVSGRMRPGADLWSDYRRFGSYVAGVSKLVAALGSPERLVASS